MLINQEDNRTPPGFAVIVHIDHISSLLCLCAGAQELLAHAYQQPASDVQVHHQQSACTSTKPARPNAAHMLAVNIKLHNYKKEEEGAHMFQ